MKPLTAISAITLAVSIAVLQAMRWSDNEWLRGLMVVLCCLSGAYSLWAFIDWIKKIKK